MTTNEIITELLQYDGYTKDVGTHSITYISEIDNEGYRTVISNEYAQTYLTNLNILHRVAVKVYRALIDSQCHDDISDITDGCSNIQFAMFSLPINGEYITLATATAEAIVYLKSHKI